MKKQGRAFLLIAALFLAALNLRPAINSVAPILEILQDKLDMSASLASLLTSIPVLCMGVFSLAAARLGIRWGIERVILVSLMVIAIGTFARLFVNSSISLIATAFVAGVGIAAIGPLLSGFIKQHFPHHVSIMIGVYSVSMFGGAALSSGLTVYLLGFENSTWRISLAFWSILAIIAIPVWMLIHSQRDRLPKEEVISRDNKLPWRNPQAWWLTVLFGLSAVLFFSLSTWIAPAVQHMGYSQAFSATVLTVFVLSQIPSSLLIPSLVQIMPNKFPWLVGCALFQGVGVLLMIVSLGNPLFAAIIMGLGAGGLFPLVLMLPIDETTNAHDASTWSAMNQSVGFIIGSLGPVFLGWIWDITGGYNWPFITLLGLCCVMVAVQYIIVTNSKQVSRSEV